MANQWLSQSFFEIPTVTRFYTTACVITTLAVHLDLVSPLQLYFNPNLIIRNFEIWRVATTFLFFGTVGFSFFFNMIFTYRYCRMLEEGSFRGRSSDFVMMFLFGGILMTILAYFVNLLFLGQAFTIMLVYVWSRRNPIVRMNFFGLLNFQAPYLPWVLLCFSMILGNTIWIDLMGMVVGHLYYFLEDVFPLQRYGCKFIKTPKFLKVMFNEHIEREYRPLPEDERPGAFNWGGEPRPNRVEQEADVPPAPANTPPPVPRATNLPEPAAAATVNAPAPAPPRPPH